MDKKLKYCPCCLGNDITSKNIKLSPDNPIIKYIGSEYSPQKYYTIYKGFVTTYTYEDNSICPTCKQPLVEMSLTEEEWNTLNYVSLEQDFIFAMDKLKQDDIIEFTTKMAQFNEIKKQYHKDKLTARQTEQFNVPKCPTCGSTNIKKISATKRYVSTGLFGLASSDLGHTQQCNDCGYKW